MKINLTRFSDMSRCISNCSAFCMACSGDMDKFYKRQKIMTSKASGKCKSSQQPRPGSLCMFSKHSPKANSIHANKTCMTKNSVSSEPYQTMVISQHHGVVRLIASIRYHSFIITKRGLSEQVSSIPMSFPESGGGLMEVLS